jgi:hypothetical protein
MIFFNNIVISYPDIGLYWAISFMQKWRIQHKEREQQWIDKVEALTIIIKA